MVQNSNAQDRMESGGVQVKTENKKKWKIPRVSSAPTCSSMQEWGLRMAMSDMILGVVFAALFFWFQTKFDETDKNLFVIKIALIIFGVMFCFMTIFGLVLYIGLKNKKNKILICVYCWYVLILSVLIFVLFVSFAIFRMVNNEEFGYGFLILFVGVLLSGYNLYIDCVVYSIYMNIVENKEEMNLKKKEAC